jgi:hypothetical protein
MSVLGELTDLASKFHSGMGGMVSEGPWPFRVTPAEEPHLEHALLRHSLWRRINSFELIGAWRDEGNPWLRPPAQMDPIMRLHDKLYRGPTAPDSWQVDTRDQFRPDDRDPARERFAIWRSGNPGAYQGVSPLLPRADSAGFGERVPLPAPGNPTSLELPTVKPAVLLYEHRLAEGWLVESGTTRNDLLVRLLTGARFLDTWQFSGFEHELAPLGDWLREHLEEPVLRVFGNFSTFLIDLVGRAHDDGWVALSTTAIWT